MFTAEQCRIYAAEYQSLGQDAAISIQRATALMGLAHTLETLAFQIDRLAIIMNKEGK